MGKNGVPDFKPPRIFSYNLKTKTLAEKTDLVLAKPLDKVLLQSTIGLRSAGAHNGVFNLSTQNTIYL